MVLRQLPRDEPESETERRLSTTTSSRTFMPFLFSFTKRVQLTVKALHFDVCGFVDGGGVVRGNSLFLNGLFRDKTTFVQNFCLFGLQQFSPASVFQPGLHSKPGKAKPWIFLGEHHYALEIIHAGRCSVLFFCFFTKREAVRFTPMASQSVDLSTGW